METRHKTTHRKETVLQNQVVKDKIKVRRPISLKHQTNVIGSDNANSIVLLIIV